MPAYNKEMQRIQSLFSGNNQANFATWQPEGEQDQGFNSAMNPALTQQQGGQSAARAMIGETPLFSDQLKSNNAYQDAIRRRMSGIGDLSTQANANAFAAAQARASSTQMTDPGTYTGQDFSQGGVNDARQTILAAAKSAVGRPYAWGGGTAKGASHGIGRGTQNLVGFDCSGLVLFALAQIGIKTSHSANAQARMGVRAPINKLRPGDLVGKPGHIAIYAGNGMMYEAPTFGKRVRLVPVRRGMFGVHMSY